jgi:polysaccharide biosynthesis/export protein
MKKQNRRISLHSMLNPIGQSCAALVLVLTSLGAQSQTTSSGASTAAQFMLQQRTQVLGAPSASSSGGPTLALEGISEVKLIPGSVLDLKVFEEPDLNGPYRIDEKGHVLIPLIGDISVEGMNLNQAQAEITAKFKNGDILKDPHVTLDLDEVVAKDIVVIGEVSNPGRYPSLVSHRLGDVLALAGGETLLAADEISIHRDGHPETDVEVIHYDRLQKDSSALSTEIEPGDSLLVKKADIVYVLGAVNRPGGYVMQESGRITLPEALALAYGTAPQAAISSIRVMRKVPDGYVEIPANYNKYEKGKATPLPLQAEDVVYVPSSLVKNILIGGKDAVSGVASASIYFAR